MEKCTSRSRALAQDMVLVARDGMQEKMRRQQIFYSSWSSPEVKFLVLGFEVAQETRPS